MSFFESGSCRSAYAVAYTCPYPLSTHSGLRVLVHAPSPSPSPPAVPPCAAQVCAGCGLLLPLMPALQSEGQPDLLLCLMLVSKEEEREWGEALQLFKWMQQVSRGAGGRVGGGA